MREQHNHGEHECHCHDSHCHEQHGGCSCGHDHEHEGGENIKGKILRYALGAIPVIVGFMSFIPFYIPIICAVAGYLIFGAEVILGMIRGFKKKEIFTEFTLMTVATFGAFAIGEYADAAALMYLYSLGEAISDGAYLRSKKSISSLIQITPEHTVVCRDGEYFEVSPDTVRVGEKIIVSAGQRVALDGVVCEGGADADTSSVTGESKLLSLYAGVACPSGALVCNGSVVLSVTAEYGDSTATRLKRAIDEARERKSAAENKISRFAAVFTPVAFCVAIGVFAVGALLTGDIARWLHAAITVLVVSCPCSLVLSVPLTYFAGMGCAAREGIVFRGGEVMDRCKDIGSVAFDKTGTITSSELSFDGAVIFSNIEKEQFLSIARTVLVHSPHMAAVSFCRESRGEIRGDITEIENIGGRGIVCRHNGKRAMFGNARLMRENGIVAPEWEGTCIFGAYDGVLVGRLDFSSHLKEGIRQTVSSLHSLGVDSVSVISGDSAAAVESACKEAGIEEYYSLAAPDEKLRIFESICEKTQAGKYSAYCGDGLNDSAVIARADVGIAMGGCGSALTAENADIVLMNDNPQGIVSAIEISRKTARVANASIALSLGIKIGVACIGAALAALGLGLPIELAMVADVGAAVITVLNSLRAARR